LPAERGRPVRVVLEVVARGVEVFVDVEVGDHLLADSELAEELLETLSAADGLSAARADSGRCRGRAAVGRAGEAGRSDSLHVVLSLLALAGLVRTSVRADARVVRFVRVVVLVVPALADDVLIALVIGAGG